MVNIVKVASNLCLKQFHLPRRLQKKDNDTSPVHIPFCTLRKYTVPIIYFITSQPF